MPFESENVEFKSRVTDGIYKEVIAFANTEGGTIYVGIDDTGNAVGLENIDESYTRITNGIRDAIRPDVTMFIKYTIQDNNVIRIAVSEGASKPYYLDTKGLRPAGVYVRQGASCAQASPEQIRQMIKNSTCEEYEAVRSMEQELTFNSAKKTFKRYNIDFSEEKYAALGICSPVDKLFTNLALIISDQCRHTTKVAVFGDDVNTVFKDAKEFTGSVFEQLELTFSYLMLSNRTTASFRGLERIEKSEYPEEAIREALLNALVHRDYSFSGSVIINVNDSFMEFISIGGLFHGLSTDDIKNGISQPRNHNLAEIFHHLRLIESYGTGIRKIFSLYKNCNAQPQIEITSNTFKLILPNMTANKEKTSVHDAMREITPQMQTVLDYLDEYHEIDAEAVQRLLGIKKTRSYTLMRQMSEKALVLSYGRGATKKYTRR